MKISRHPHPTIYIIRYILSTCIKKLWQVNHAVERQFDKIEFCKPVDSDMANFNPPVKYVLKKKKRYVSRQFLGLVPGMNLDLNEIMYHVTSSLWVEWYQFKLEMRRGLLQKILTSFEFPQIKLKDLQCTC